MVTGIGLLSGGLDSILAARILQEQGIEIIGVSFITPFFSADNARRAARLLGIPLQVIDITEVHLAMVKSPKHGYGSHLNPCIDCHALMFRQAGAVLQQRGADFLFSGEVLGQRPMSQNKQSLQVVAKESGFQEFIVRPLSARLLPVTKPEQDGRIDREQLLDIHGRSRKRQMELAAAYGITSYPEPAGGCRLTEPHFAKRLKDLMEHQAALAVRDIELLKIGRHFRLSPHTKLIVGRNQQENAGLLELHNPADLVITVASIPGPTGLIPLTGASTSEGQELIVRAASICVRYSDAPAGTLVEVTLSQHNRLSNISCSACPDTETDRLHI